MKRTMILAVLVLLLASIAGAATHPLVGTWRLTSQMWGSTFIDLITITSASPGTHRVHGYIQGLKIIIDGYYFDDIVILAQRHADTYAEGWHFVFRGPHKFGKHLGICVYPAGKTLTTWHSMTAGKVSPSTRPGDRDAYGRRQMLKALADINSAGESQGRVAR